jgi:xanthosine utilization system XapX-like protein
MNNKQRLFLLVFGIMLVFAGAPPILAMVSILLGAMVYSVKNKIQKRTNLKA